MWIVRLAITALILRQRPLLALQDITLLEGKQVVQFVLMASYVRQRRVRQCYAAKVIIQ